MPTLEKALTVFAGQFCVTGSRLLVQRDIDRSLRVASELEAGTVWVNDWAVVYDEFE